MSSPSTVWKSIGAVAAGIIANIVVTTMVDIVLHLTQVYGAMNEPLDNPHALLASSYRIVITIAAGYLTARLAPQNPMRHVMILGWLGVLLGLVGVVATWNANLGPRWYAIALPVLALPECWLGGWLFTRRGRRVPTQG